MTQTSYLVLIALFVSMAPVGGTFAPIAFGQEGQQDEAKGVPDPARMLRLAMQKLEEHSRKNGYQIECLAKGGLSNKGDHEVWMHQVYEEHRGVIQGDLMFVEELQVYRNPSKGAIRIDDNWIPLQDSPAGKRLERIVHFPSRLLLTAATRGRKVEWIEPVVEVDLNDPDYVDPMDPLEEPEGGTAVVEKPAPISSYERIKIEVDEKMAVEYFNAVQKSGLLGGTL
ncbi:MAG: hypothetical protein VYD70_06555 [Planctomycetota bacterium]|nr:hypothetical protein [Planctomycetota bacterium]